MIRLTVSSLIIATVAAVAFLVPAWGSSPGLTGEVGPGFKIEVKRAGKDLKTIKPGMYKIKIEDKASIHNFHLIGPGVNRKTGIAFKGQTTWTIRLRLGRYTYRCDPHAAGGMKGHFTVKR